MTEIAVCNIYLKSGNTISVTAEVDGESLSADDASKQLFEDLEGENAAGFLIVGSTIFNLESVEAISFDSYNTDPILVGESREA